MLLSSCTKTEKHLFSYKKIHSEQKLIMSKVTLFFLIAEKYTVFFVFDSLERRFTANKTPLSYRAPIIQNQQASTTPKGGTPFGAFGIAIQSEWHPPPSQGGLG